MYPTTKDLQGQSRVMNKLTFKGHPPCTRTNSFVGRTIDRVSSDTFL